MKTFYDLLATDQCHNIDVVIDMSSITDNGIPGCSISINRAVYYRDQLKDNIEISEKVYLLEPITIEIEMFGKKYSQSSETAVLINQIQIDGFNLIPGYIHLSQYINDHARDTPTSYLGYNGIWRFDIDRPFYQWKHQNTGQGWLLTPIPATQ